MKRQLLYTVQVLALLFNALVGVNTTAFAQGGQATVVRNGVSLPSGVPLNSVFILSAPSTNPGLYQCNNSPTCTSASQWVYYLNATPVGANSGQVSIPPGSSGLPTPASGNYNITASPSQTTTIQEVKPSVAASGLYHTTNASGVLTDIISGVAVGDLTATGTPSSSTYLRGDWTWASLSGTGTVQSGTAVLGTSSIASGACATVVTVTATGVATTDVLTASFNGDPTGVTGYIPVTTGTLTIYPYPTANAVNFKVCNGTASSITPGAITLNWRVGR